MERSAEALLAENSDAQVKLVATVGTLDHETATTFVEGEKWNVAQLVEHIAIVEEGIGKLCYSLLKKARSEGSPTTNGVELSERFMEALNASLTEKLSAPESVHPSEHPVSIAHSLDRLKQSGRHIEELAPLFEQFNSTSHTFPHPHWGKMTAGEWLSIVGAHKLRHIRQINSVLDKIEKEKSSGYEEG